MCININPLFYNKLFTASTQNATLHQRKMKTKLRKNISAGISILFPGFGN